MSVARGCKFPGVHGWALTAATVAGAKVLRLKLDSGVPGGTNAGGRFSVRLFLAPSLAGVGGVSTQKPLEDGCQLRCRRSTGYILHQSTLESVCAPPMEQGKVAVSKKWSDEGY